jgi:flagellar hook-associated protein 3 FlgL
MRVAQSESYRNFLANIEKLNDFLNTVNRQVSSGKKVNQLKDAPDASAQLVSLRDEAAEIDQYQSNIDTGSFFLGMADSILNEVNNLVTCIYAKGSQSASDTVSSDARAVLATEIRSFRDQILTLANSQVRGRYIFAGSQVSSVPFTIDEDAVQYQGDQDASRISVDDGLEVKQSIPGSAAFQSIFNTIESLLIRMDRNDLSGIQSALTQFASALSGLGQARGEIGANLNLLEKVKTHLQSEELSLNEQKSRIEDTNMAEAIVQLNQAKTALDTALTAGGSILQQSNLFDILG